MGQTVITGKIIINGRFLCQPTSGVQRVAFNVAVKLQQLNPAIIIVCPKNIKQTEWAKVLNVTPYGYLKGHLWEQLELPLFLKKQDKPLLVNFGNTGALCYSNQVILLHDIAFLTHPQYFSFAFKTLYKFLWVFLPYKVKHIITVSQFSKTEIEHYLPKTIGKISVIYNGFNNLSALATTTNEPTEPYFLMVGNWDGRKNMPQAIQAFMANNFTKVKLKIVGASNPVFKNKVTQYPESVQFLGQQNDAQLANLYKNAIALVYPSLYEGFGLPPLEAMACECPVIASNITVFHEVLGSSALFVNPYVRQEIQQAMLTLYHNPTLQQELKTKGLQQIKKYHWDTTAGEYLVLLKKMKCENEAPNE